jgi:hypothetical protein
VALNRLDGANVGVEVHLLPQGNDGRRVAGNFVGGGGNGTEHGSSALTTESLDGLAGESGAGLLEVLETSVEVDEGRLGDTRDRLKDALSSLKSSTDWISVFL